MKKPRRWIGILAVTIWLACLLAQYYLVPGSVRTQYADATAGRLYPELIRFADLLMSVGSFMYLMTLVGMIFGNERFTKMTVGALVLVTISSIAVLVSSYENSWPRFYMFQAGWLPTLAFVASYVSLYAAMILNLMLPPPKVPSAAVEFSKAQKTTA